MWRSTGDIGAVGRPFSAGLRPLRSMIFPILLLLLGALGGCTAERRGSVPRNLLLITVDTLRADRLGCCGGLEARTPNIDRLAKEGALFTNCFCAIPITLPSHASIMTGLHPRTHRVLSHGYTLAEEQTTLAEVLKENGYDTAAFISSHVLDSKYGIAQGFDTYWERYDYNARLANQILQESGYDILNEAVEQWSEASLQEPYFIWVHWFHPHKPYEPPPPMRGIYDHRKDKSLRADVETLRRVWKGELDLTPEEVEEFRDLYDGEVTFTDRQVGKLLKHFESAGLLDRTLVVLTADHGEMLYEQDRYFGHDIMLYEPSIRVPLILWAPGIVPSRIISDATVRSVDLFPTLLDLLGIQQEGLDVEGQSIVPALRGETLSEAPVFAEVFPPKEDWKSSPRHSVRFQEWKLITVEGRERAELYRLDSDPGESANLATKQAAKRSEMEELLAGWMKNEVEEELPELDPDERRILKDLGYIGD